jgi:CRISPR/Cas system-associated endoribonuclease Cas2
MKVKKPKRHLRAGSWMLETFMSIADEMSAVCIEGHHPSTVLRYGADGARYFRDAKERKLERQRIRRLEKKKLIMIQQIGENYEVKLTDEGAVELLKQRVVNAPMMESDLMCMVVFDIPENNRKLRKQIRSVLKESGFIPIQRSVWVSPFDAGEALREFFKIKSMVQWVRIYDAKEH